jgi:uncharacterized protein YjbI with pentapeptide repeats
MKKNQEKSDKDRFFARRLFPISESSPSKYEIKKQDVMSLMETLKKERREIIEDISVSHSNNNFEALKERISSTDAEEANLALYSLDKNGVLESGEISHKQFKNLNFKGVLIFNANLVGTTWVQVNLNNVTFLNCDLTEAVFSGNDLSSCVFENCNLTKTNFSACQLQNVWLNTDENTIQGLANFEHSNLANSFVTGNFTQSNMITIDAHEVWFKFTDLRGANLRGANLLNAVFDLIRINEHTIMPDGKPHNTRTNPISRFISEQDPRFWSA